MAKNIIGYTVNVVAPNVAKQYITFSRREGEKINIVPGDIVPEKIAAVENDLYWNLQLKKMGNLR